MKRLWIVVAALVALPASVAGAPGSLASSAASFADTAGDGGSGPDVTAVTVSNDDVGNVTFRVAIPNRPTLGASFTFEIYVDTDRNPATGDPEFGGAELRLVAIDDKAAILYAGEAFVGGRLIDVIAVSWSRSFTYRDGVTLTVGARDLEGVRAFDFRIRTSDGTGVADSDDAPDAGVWTYTIVRAPVSLAVRRFSILPARGPVASEPFAVRMRVERRGTNASIPLLDAEVSCRATLAGRRLPAPAQAVRGGASECAWELPRSARGKRLAGSIEVAYGGAKACRSFSYVVR